mgnify:CR=1 FL=1
MGNGHPLAAILRAHASRYPAWQARDVYKLVFQGVFGAEHAAADDEELRARLEAEIAGLRDAPAEPLIDPITPGGALVRVHLRPLLAVRACDARRATEELLAAFARSTRRPPSGSPGEFAAAWRGACELAAEGLLHVPAARLAEVGAQMEAAGFPAARHSPEYTRAYAPAYRVVRAACLPPGFAG